MTSNQQARMDALADAETLRRVAVELSLRGPSRNRAAAFMRVRLESAQQAHQSIEFRAAAAFRAVPALAGRRS